ncbi:MAG: nucleotidyltransferase domain-containing protein [Methanotrichaceae archaeon]|nr:nucleotidyltransferase domain-containing protein [Methanotrichaceae archaeon]
MKARIRDFFETIDGWIFAVADYSHPEGIRSLLRYVPDPAGEREAGNVGGIRYRKMDFDPSFEFLKKARPGYVKDLHVVPEADVVRFFRPADGLRSVAAKDARVNRIAMLLANAGVPWEEMGITGSMLIGLHSPSSDIDFVVYGPWWWKARDILAQAKAEGRIDELDDATWWKIYSKRKPETSFEEFVLHEKRKGNRGMIDKTYFDLLFTRDWSQIRPTLPGKPVGRRKIVAEVKDATFSFDSPAIYRLNHDEVKEVFCYSHTYAGQALPGEILEANGVVEETAEGLRLVVGTTREARGEWIRSLTLLEAEDETGRWKRKID